jgi:hypothetical protein
MSAEPAAQPVGPVKDRLAGLSAGWSGWAPVASRNDVLYSAPVNFRLEYSEPVCEPAVPAGRPAEPV